MINESTFVRGNDRLRKTLERPGIAQAVAAIEDEAAELDRTHAMSLAMIREAGRLPQTDIARTLKITQAAVSPVENRGDLPLSTLRSYLVAAGAMDLRIVLSVNGHDVVVAPETIAGKVQSQHSLLERCPVLLQSPVGDSGSDREA